MTQYIFATESYPFTADLASLVPLEPHESILLTRDVHKSMSDTDRRRFNRIIEVEQFDFKSLETALGPLQLHSDARIISHDDFYYEQFALVGQRLGLTGYTVDSILPFVNKHVTKSRLVGSGIRVPRYRLFDPEAFSRDGLQWLRSVGAQLGYPMFIKPIQGAGAEHSILVRDEAEFIEWARRRKPDIIFEIDEFIGEAILYHCDSVLWRGRPVFTQVCRYSNPCADFAKGRMVGSYTLGEEDECHGPMTQFTSDVFAALARHHLLPDGVTHMEMFRKASGEIVFLEVQFRPPGANVRRAYAEFLGVNFEEIHYRLQMGADAGSIRACGPYAAWMYFPTADGVVATLEPLPNLYSTIVECSYGIQHGQPTRSPESILDAWGRGVVALSLVITNFDHEQLRQDFAKLQDYIPFRLL